MFRSHLMFFGCALPLFILILGCNSTAKTTVTTSSSSVSDVPSIQHSADIAQIKAAYRAKAYQDALVKLKALAKKPGLAPADKVYLERQIAICQDAVGGKSKTGMAPTLPISQTAPASSDCGPRALYFICQEKRIPTSISALSKTAGMKPGVGVSISGLAKAAQSVGFAAEGVQVDLDAMRRVSPPAIAWVDGNHFVAVTKIKNDSATIHDPNKERKEEVTLEKLLQRSGGVLLLLKHKRSTDRTTESPVATG